MDTMPPPKHDHARLKREAEDRRFALGAVIGVVSGAMFWIGFTLGALLF